jgi:hypothetical protein
MGKPEFTFRYKIRNWSEYNRALVRGRGRVARPFGFALTDPGVQLSRTRLFPKVTRIMPDGASMGV